MSDGRALDELTEEIADIRKKLASSSMIESASKKLKEAQQKLTTIERLMAEKNVELTALFENQPTVLQDIYEKRSNLLAEIELGNASANDLTAFDKKYKPEIDKSYKDYDKRGEVEETISQLMEGLDGKAVALREEIALLSADVEEFSLQAVMGLALDKGARYTKLAVEAAQLYRELCTLNATAQAAGMGDDFNGLFGLLGAQSTPYLPALNVPPFVGEFGNNSWKIFDGAFMWAHRRPFGVPVVELEPLRKAGAVIPALPSHLIEQ